MSFTSNDYDSFYNDLPKNNEGVALTFRFLCEKLNSGLVAVPIEEESFVALYYCFRRDHAKSMALEKFSDFIYQNIDVRE